MERWHCMTADECAVALGADVERGLSEAEAGQRLAQYGENALPERDARGPWQVLWEQLTSVMVLILIAAAAVSALLGDFKDMAVISAIVVLNTALGFSQDYRAEKAMAALRKLAVPRVKARRDGQIRDLSSRELVPGDVVLLETGSLVPADCRLLTGFNLRVQEAALTGESEPVDKDAGLDLPEGAPLGDRRNLLFMGTIVTYGRGLALVVATGAQTQLGKIAAMMQSLGREPTPLQRRLDHLGRLLGAVALSVAAVVFVLGLLRGEELRLMILTAVSMAVAAVPEGLPAVVTVALALGAQRMLKRRALMRKLAAVETLGSVTVICSDKTGTLTQNRMSVTVLDLAGHRLEFEDLAGARSQSGANGHPADTGIATLLTAAALCNDAILSAGDNGAEEAVGDPTETALVMAALRLGLAKPELEACLPRLAEVPFDSERKLMTTVHAANALPGVGRMVSEPYVAFTKGAVDRLVALSSRVWVEGETEPLTDSWRARIAAANDGLAGQGMRVLGVALRPLAALPANGDGVEADLTFVGLVAMIDPARPEAREAVRTCRRAGIRPIMITGDHALTARYIAAELGISDGGGVLTGAELEEMSPEELERTVAEVSVYARVSPEHKLRIVQALQKRGEIVAMTGDGVNDAPALKKADIGVAMGIAGTDVAKEAADMVLGDDNFATIVAAVEEGRTIYDNIRKFVRFLLTTNSAEIWTMLVALFIGMPLPLLPLQLLWVNLVTDGLPALALGFEPAERDVMSRPPHRPGESVLARGTGRHVLWVGWLMALLALGSGFFFWREGRVTWQTTLFTTLALAQMAHVLAIRSGRESLLRAGLTSNRPLLGAVALTLVAQMAVVYLPWLQGLFGTVALSAGELAVALAASLGVFLAVEGEKWLACRSERSAAPTDERSGA